MGILTNEKPERTWIDWPQPNATGLAFSCHARPPALRTEYVRADLVDAEVARLTEALAEAEKRVTEAACDVVDAYSEFDRPYCCDGRMCGCQGQSVHDMMKHFIRAMVRP